MKIAFVCARSVPAYLGGAEELARTNAKFLVTAGHKVTILTSYINEGLEKRLIHEEIIDEVRILRFRQWRFEQFWWLPRLLKMFRHQPVKRKDNPITCTTSGNYQPSKLQRLFFQFSCEWLSWIFSPSLFWHICCSDYDLIHVAPFPHTHIWFATRAANLVGIPVVFSPAYHVELQYNVAWQMEYLARRASQLVVFTEKERLDLLELGVPLEKLSIVPPGVCDAEVYKGSGDRFRHKYGLKDHPIVLFAGAKGSDKGFDHVVDAMVIVRQTIPDAVFVSIGRGSEELHDQVRMKLPNSLNLGFIPIEEKNDAFDACTVFVMPSRCDSFGIVYVEAWLHRKPVIAARAGSVPWVVHEGEDGELVAFGDVHDIAKKVILLLNNPQRCERFGVNGYQFVMTNYMGHIIAERLIKCYKLCDKVLV